MSRPVALPPKAKAPSICSSAGPNFNIQDNCCNGHNTTASKHYSGVVGMDGTHVVEELHQLARKEAVLGFS